MCAFQNFQNYFKFARVSLDSSVCSKLESSDALEWSIAIETIMTRAPDLSDDMEHSDAAGRFVTAILAFYSDPNRARQHGQLALQAFHALCRQLIQGAPLLIADVFSQLSRTLRHSFLEEEGRRGPSSRPPSASALHPAQGWFILHCRLAREIQLAWPYLPEDATLQAS